MGSIFLLYQTQGLFIICAPDTDVTKNSQGDYHEQRVTKKSSKII